MTRSAHQPSNQPGLGGGGEDVVRELKGSEKGGMKRDRGGEEGEGRQGCPSFKHAGLNGTDSSDILPLNHF